MPDLSDHNLRPAAPDVLYAVRALIETDPGPWPTPIAAQVCPVFRHITGLPVASRIPPDVLDDLRWQAEHPAALVTMSKPVLRALLDAYDRQHGGMRVVGSLSAVTGGERG